MHDFTSSPHDHSRSTSGGGIAFAENECPQQGNWQYTEGEDLNMVVGTCIARVLRRGPGHDNTPALHQHDGRRTDRSAAASTTVGGKITIVQDYRQLMQWSLEHGMVVRRAGAGPRVVWIHGLGESSVSFEPVVAAMPGFTHVLVDLPGLRPLAVARAARVGLDALARSPRALARSGTAGGDHRALDGRRAAHVDRRAHRGARDRQHRRQPLARRLHVLEQASASRSRIRRARSADDARAGVRRGRDAARAARAITRR